jgi:ABC-type molybdenum transport system ATPase subunit/photorepair protein PhrA
VKNLIIIRGLSGSGKTTLANLICDGLKDRFMVSADDFFTDENGVYTFNHLKIKEAHGWCKNECKEAMEGGWGVIVVHNTFTRKWEVDPYMEMARKNEYQVRVVSLYDGGLSDHELSDRGLHNLPPHQVRKQRVRWDSDVYRVRRPMEHHPTTQTPLGYRGHGGFHKKNRHW